MKLYKLPKAHWLWLSLLCLSMLLCIALVEVFFIYPQALRYFDNSESLTAQSLSARSRGYLHKSLELVLVSPSNPSSNAQIRQNLDIAYGLLNINLYITQYPCTTPSLKKIEQLSQQLSGPNLPDIALFTRTILPVLQCAEQVQINQDNKRSALALEMLEDLDFQRQLLLWGTLLIFTIAFSFAALYLKHTKIITFNRKQTHKWFRHATRDSLTGTLNRRAFNRDLAQYVKKYSHHDQSFSLLMCDVDYFKLYNDTLGHVAGDKALKEVANTLKKALRDHDKIYRYGGEEMAIILDNTTPSQAQRIGLRILDLLKERQLPHPKSEFAYVTVSIGCATINKNTNSGEHLIQTADKRLYTAKQSGRNCFISHVA